MNTNTEKPVVHFKGTAFFRQRHPELPAEVAEVFALDHPKLGCMPVRTSEVLQKFDDGSFETMNTIYKPEAA